MKQFIIIFQMVFGVLIISSTFAQTDIDKERYYYVIITADSLVDVVSPLADWKTTKGIRTYIATLEWIQNNYSGIDIQEQIRNFLIWAHQNWQTKFVLLAGDVSTIPPRYIWLKDPDAPYNPGAMAGLPYEPTDDYYTNLDGNWNADGDRKYGEKIEWCALGVDEIDWTPELSVGRLPADDRIRMNTMVQKIINYEMNPPAGEWTNSVMLVGACFWWPFIDCMAAKEEVRKNDFPDSGLVFHTLYDSPMRGIHTLTRENYINTFNQGNTIVNSISHGWVDYAPTMKARGAVPYVTLEDALTMHNGMKLPLVVMCACLTMCYDSWQFGVETDCLGEGFMYNPNGGAIGFIGAQRVDMYLEYYLFDHLFDEHDADFRPGVALTKAKLEYGELLLSRGDDQINHERKLWAVTNYLGDPELQILTADPQPMVVTCPDTVSVGAIFTVQVNNLSGVPIRRALVCAKNDDNYYQISRTNRDGYCKFRAPADDDELLITVTAHNYRYEQQNITVTNYEGIASSSDEISYLTDMLNGTGTKFFSNSNQVDFSPTLEFNFVKPSPCYTTVKIYDVSGMLIQTTVAKELNEDTCIVNWDSCNHYNKPVANGVYFYSIKTRDVEKIRKLVILQ